MRWPDIVQFHAPEMLVFFTHMAASVKLLAFDLDGTLIDSLNDLHSALVRALSSLGFPPPSSDAVRLAIGDGAGLLVRRLLPADVTEEKMQAAFQRFRAEYRDHACDASVLYPGVPEFFAELSQRPGHPHLAVLTNKPEIPARAILEHFGLFARGVEWLVGGDTLESHKPDPAGLHLLMKKAGATPETTVMVGDGAADQGVARNAGARFIAIQSNYGNPNAFIDRPKDACSFEEFAENWLARKL